MPFDHPQYLIWLWIFIPVAALLAWAVRRRRRILNAFAAPEHHKILLPGYAPKRRWLKAGLILSALALAIVALAGPRYGFRWEQTHRRGVDIMIALDCSRSMLATDIQPNRLEQAKREIIDLLNRVTGDRVGLVAFSGQAILQCPLTLDHGAFQVFLKVLSPDYMPVDGTHIKAALEAAASGFDPDMETEKAVILITDGENTAGDLTDTLNTIATQGIRIFSIGVGDPKGAPIPDVQGGFKKDARGNIILSKVDMAALEKMAQATGGLAVRSVAGDMDLEKIYIQRIKGTMEQKDVVQGKRRVWENRFQWLLFPCVLLLLWEIWLPLYRRPSRSRSRVGGTTLCLLVLSGLWMTPARANTVQDGIEAYNAQGFEKAKARFIEAQLKDPDDPRLYYNIGTAAYKTGDYDLAEKQFKRAAEGTDPTLRQNALYNLGNTQYRNGDLEASLETFENLVKEFPEDQQAKENLEFVKAQKNKPPQNQNQDQNQGQNKDGKDQKQGDQADKNQGQGKQDQDQQNRSGQDKGQSDPQKGQSGQGKNADPGDKPKGDPQQAPQPGDQDKSPKRGQDNADKGEASKPGQEEGAPKPPDPKPDPKSVAAQAQDGQGDSKNKRDQEEQGAMAQGGKADPARDPAQAALEQKLNRLEDKPGMALMPVGDARDIEKDW